MERLRSSAVQQPWTSGNVLGGMCWHWGSSPCAEEQDLAWLFLLHPLVLAHPSAGLFLGPWNILGWKVPKGSSKSNPCTGHPTNPTLCFLGLCCSRSWALMDSWPSGGGLMAQSEGMAFLIPAFVCWRPGRQSSRPSFSCRFHPRVWSHPAQIKHRFLKFMLSEKNSFRFYMPSFRAFLTTPLML